MKILFFVLLLLLVGCATEQEKLTMHEDWLRANDRYEEVKAYCDERGLPTNVDCEAGRACQKHPNRREMLTAYCVIWR